ncbi:hypothetical protein H7J86_24330 [Mycobacterium hackensackense]|uniref:hypothetical protein n=1 Tax=Mycobacterium hackensackense TaxID=228909 RepID=UPI0022659C9E|nr:hypothetical protein [Mycobacterium hackensackense]MCV7255295.1 hypothetical protein [Mycobacterium hackensackense]
MAQIVQILPSITLAIQGGGTVTLTQLQSFIDQATSLGVDPDKELETTIKAPYHYDQRDHDPGSFAIVAAP